jgi:glutamate 5-kinase
MSNQQERWVIKAGSSLIAGKDDGINKSFIKDLVLQVEQLLNEGIQVSCSIGYIIMTDKNLCGFYFKI